MGIAVIGAGYWGKNLVRNFHSLGALKIVCDADIETREKILKEYKNVKVTDDYNSILKDSSVEAVVIASPAETHFDLAMKALNAGKDVFVEKPLALNSSDGKKLVETAEEKKRILFVGHILHYHPAIIKLKAMLSHGIIGRIEYIYSNRLSLGKIRREENILWSFAPHDISIMLGITGEMPNYIDCTGSNFLHAKIADVTMSNFKFPSGISAHIFVSWLNPFKEQKLVIVGSNGMLVFDDTLDVNMKLVHYPHIINWKNGMPFPEKAQGINIELSEDWIEPLKNECMEFLNAVKTRKKPITSGEEGLKVLAVLNECQLHIESKEPSQTFSIPREKPQELKYFAHQTATIDEGAEIGEGTKIWHYSHVLKGAKIGKGCILGQNVNVDGGTVIGDNVKIQNNISVYTGLEIEDNAFLGPSCVFTNVSNPRSEIKRHSLYEKTIVRKGATIGANATIVCGVTIGRYAFIAAGAVVTKNVPDYALIMGNPGKQAGWMSRHGHRLINKDSKGIMICPESGFKYQEKEPGRLVCLDINEDSDLPMDKKKGDVSYREIKAKRS
ncbi:MAG: hypothetical protein ACD_79C00120G0003 [uncultured bacterium]|nr:MAG: hypothetical protein ACD_79C00120G0003 [uncultured bacterium]